MCADANVAEVTDVGHRDFSQLHMDALLAEVRRTRGLVATELAVAWPG